MSPRQHSRAPSRERPPAPVFAALGDETRLGLIGKLSAGRPCSISQLTAGSSLSRQAITKHLRVLEDVGIVHSARAGRESLFELNPQPLEGIKEYLDFVSEQWGQALARLSKFLDD